MKKLVMFILVTMSFVGAHATAKTTQKRKVANVSQPSSSQPAGQCSLISIENLAENDHACTGTWMATRSDDKVLFCCQPGSP